MTSVAPPSQYAFDTNKTEEIFDFMLKERIIKLPSNLKPPTKEEMGGREYCKYYDSLNHNTNNRWALKGVIQDRINNKDLKFPKKKDFILIDEDPFPLVASISTVVMDL